MRSGEEIDGKRSNAPTLGGGRLCRHADVFADELDTFEKLATRVRRNFVVAVVTPATRTYVEKVREMTQCKLNVSCAYQTRQDSRLRAIACDTDRGVL